LVIGLWFVVRGLWSITAKGGSYIPAVILVLFGAVLGLGFGGLLDWLWIGALFLAGLILILFALLRRR